MSIKCSALPFTLTCLQSEQPSANRLYFKLDRALGELPSTDDSVTVTSSTLSLPLARPLSDQPPPNKLPFNLTRKLGTLTSGDNSTPVEPPEPTEPRRTYTIAAGLTATTSKSVGINKTAQIKTAKRHTVSSSQRISNKQTTTITQCQRLSTPQLTQISSCQRVETIRIMQISKQLNLHSERLILINQCQSLLNLRLINLARCLDVNTPKAYHLYRCQSVVTSQSIELIKCAKVGSQLAINIADSQIAASLKAVPIPCRYYPIPEPPPEAPKFSCRPRPPSSQLPLNLSRRGNIPSSNLPLRLMCWHDKTPIFVPNLRTYTVHNEISADIGGIVIDPLKFGVSATREGAYWQGSIDISYHDYQSVKSIVDVDQGQEPLISVTVNNQRYAFLAESPTENESFANHTFTIGGRSATSRLGSDYAKANDRYFDADSYARQLVNEQLLNTAFTLDSFDITDYRIPANTYTASNQSPIAIINDIADAAGGYIESHPFEPKLSVKKRWSTLAWELKSATPKGNIPSDIILNISKSIVKQPRYNAVLLVGNTYADTIYRELQSRDQLAPTLYNPLFSDQASTIAKGGQVLSDSGAYAMYQIKTLWLNDADLYQIGDVWQIKGEFNGLVTSAALSADVKNNGAVEVYQNINVLRYLGE